MAGGGFGITYIPTYVYTYVRTCVENRSWTEELHVFFVTDASRLGWAGPIS